MKTSRYLAIILAGFFTLAACQKEYSTESGLPTAYATGTFQSDSGQCNPITVHGNFVKDSILTDSSYVVVQLNVFSPGIYKIYSDTSNGFSFYDSGYITATGLQNIRLKASGTPILSNATNFSILFDSASFCSFIVNVTDTVTVPPIITPVTSGDYFPTGSFSNWTYTESINSDTNRITVSNSDVLITGNTYRSFVFSNTTTGADTAYFRKGGGLYYQYSNLDEFSNYDTVNDKVDFIFLKDNEPVGSTWESPEVNATYNSTEGKAKIGFEISGKDIQVTIGATVIDSVIKVKRDYIFTPTTTGTPLNLGSIYYYYAKNIGFIKAETTDPFPFTVLINRWEIYY